MLRGIGKSDYKQICSWFKRYKYDYFNNQLKNVGNIPVMKYKTIFDRKELKDEKNS